jgi:hypothetical protein
MKLTVLTSFIVLWTMSFSQTTVVRVVTKNRLNNDPISQVHILQTSNDTLVQKAITNNKGVAYLRVNANETVAFTFAHVGFAPLDSYEKMVFKGGEKDTTTIQVRMYFNKTRELEGVTIKPAGVPDTIFESKRLSVADFEFLPDDNLVLLTYPRNMNRGTELLVYDGYKVMSELPIKEKGKELIRDFRGNPHLVTENNVFGIYKNNLQLELSQLPKDYFLTYIAPIIDTAHSKYYFSNFNEKYPAFDYYAFDQLDSTFRKIANITDDLMMELYRSEFKWVDVRTKIWAKEKEMATGIDKEIWVGAAYFTQSIYYKELYAPLFERNDSIFLFDHYKNYMYTYSFGGYLLDSIPIFYHLEPKSNGWKRNIIQDDVTGEIYLYFENDGQVTLRHYNTKSGQLGSPIALTFNYAEEVKVHHNSVYYVYRPFESIQKKYLYRERLPVDFTPLKK